MTVTITNGYCTLDQLAETMLAGNTFSGSDEGNGARAINTASRWVDEYCGRSFFDAGSATARVFRASDYYCVQVNDFSTTTGLVIATDPGDTGTFSQTWTTSDYELWPYDTSARIGGLQWPFSKILAVRSLTFPTGFRSSVQVTARWGWTAVPDAVQQAALHMAEFVFKAKDAPFGSAGLTDLGIVRARIPAIVTELLAPYRREGTPGGPMVA